jgi:hypothetical protein
MASKLPTEPLHLYTGSINKSIMSVLQPKRGFKGIAQKLRSFATSKMLPKKAIKRVEKVIENKKKNKNKKIQNHKNEEFKGTNKMTTQTAPTNISVTRRNSGANFGRSNTITIRHREYVKDITSATTFTVTGVAINPGLPTFTAWLSNIAPWYESYVMHKLSFEYVPMIATSASGRMIYAVDYDADDSDPTTLTECENTGDSTSSSIWAPFTLHCQKRNLHKMVKERYVRVGDTTHDLKTYDVGRFLVGVDGCSDAVTKIGQVYAVYEVTFITPQLHRDPVSLSHAFNRFASTRILTPALAIATSTTVWYPLENNSTGILWGDDSAFLSPTYYNTKVVTSRTCLVLPTGTYSCQWLMHVAGTSITGAGSISISIGTNVTSNQAYAAGAIVSGAGDSYRYQQNTFTVTTLAVNNGTNTLSFAVTNPTFASASSTELLFTFGPVMYANIAEPDPLETKLTMLEDMIKKLSKNKISIHEHKNSDDDDELDYKEALKQKIIEYDTLVSRPSTSRK